MVAKITMPRSAQKVLYYNENKVSTDKAVCIGGENFLDDALSMTWQQKLDTFRLRNELNDRAGTRMIHISLNFDPSELLSPETLNRMAAVYMQKIGFGEQPYLVYQHHDAGIRISTSSAPPYALTAAGSPHTIWDATSLKKRGKKLRCLSV